jgi:AraC-like DNA-binding protein
MKVKTEGAQQNSRRNHHPGFYRQLLCAKLLIDQHYAECLDLNALASAACFSKFHFIRLFKTVYKRTPHQYLREVRVERASLLLTRELSIADVCDAVGFQSPGAFCTVFKEHTGLSPAAYREQLRIRRLRLKTEPLAFVPGCHSRALHKGSASS